MNTKMNNLKTITFLNNLLNKNYDTIQSLDKLNEEYGIKYSRNENYPNLFVLNYCQINSSKYKFTDIIKECRSLVVEIKNKKCKLVSQAFDRFFNYGEEPENKNIDITKMSAFEKIDGSLVSIFFYEDKWLYRTKSMIMPDDEALMITGRKWKELIESLIIGPFYYKHCTYIFEIVSKDNRVVTRYDEDAAYLLAVRDNSTGLYYNSKPIFDQLSKISSRIKLPKKYTFKSIDDCILASIELQNLEEGYVLYDTLKRPCLKMKSPAYVAAHRLRGESILTPKRIVHMLQINEQDEYLSIFPEDKKDFKIWQTKWNDLIIDFYNKWQDVKDIKDQKDFSLEIMKSHKHISMFFFKIRQKNQKVVNLMKDIQTEKLVEILKNY